jgi:hypothetical protein
MATTNYPPPTKGGKPVMLPNTGQDTYVDPYDSPTAPNTGTIPPATADGSNMKTPHNEAAFEQLKNTPRPSGGNASPGNINPDSKTIVGMDRT